MAVTALVLAVMRWPADAYLAVLALVCAVAAITGLLARRPQAPPRLAGDRPHVLGMGISYVALLTAFYVDNGPHLPVLDQLPTAVPDAVECSVEYFATGGLYCSEAILRAFNEVHDLGLPTAAYAMATPFGAGMGTAKCSCGAVTGGQMVLGLSRGRSSTTESEGPAFDAAKKLHDRFRARYKVICWRGLTRKLPWGEPEHHQACQEYVRFAAAEVADLLQVGPDGSDTAEA